MDSDYGVPRELSEVQKKRTLYQPELPPCLQVRTANAPPRYSCYVPRVRHCPPPGTDLRSLRSCGARSRIVLPPDRFVPSAMIFTVHRSRTPDLFIRDQDTVRI
jgi:hypothetical protein